MNKTSSADELVFRKRVGAALLVVALGMVGLWQFIAFLIRDLPNQGGAVSRETLVLLVDAANVAVLLVLVFIILAVFVVISTIQIQMPLAESE